MRLYLHPSERRPDPEPLHTDDRAAVLVGLAVWLILLVVAVVARDRLVADGRGWWIWTCAAGAGLGVLGLGYLHHREVRRRRYQAAESSSAGVSSASASSASSPPAASG